MKSLIIVSTALLLFTLCILLCIHNEDQKVILKGRVFLEGDLLKNAEIEVEFKNKESQDVRIISTDSNGELEIESDSLKDNSEIKFRYNKTLSAVELVFSKKLFNEYQIISFKENKIKKQIPLSDVKNQLLNIRKGIVCSKTNKSLFNTKIVFFEPNKKISFAKITDINGIVDLSSVTPGDYKVFLENYRDIFTKVSIDSSQNDVAIIFNLGNSLNVIAKDQDGQVLNLYYLHIKQINASSVDIWVPKNIETRHIAGESFQEENYNLTIPELPIGSYLFQVLSFNRGWSQTNIDIADKDNVCYLTVGGIYKNVNILLRDQDGQPVIDARMQPSNEFCDNFKELGSGPFIPNPYKLKHVDSGSYSVNILPGTGSMIAIISPTCGGILVESDELYKTRVATLIKDRAVFGRLYLRGISDRINIKLYFQAKDRGIKYRSCWTDSNGGFCFLVGGDEIPESILVDHKINNEQIKIKQSAEVGKMIQIAQ